MELEYTGSNNVISMEDQIKNIQKNLYRVPLNFRESNAVSDMVMMRDYHGLIRFLKDKGYSFEEIANGKFYS